MNIATGPSEDSGPNVSGATSVDTEGGGAGIFKLNGDLISDL